MPASIINAPVGHEAEGFNEGGDVGCMMIDSLHQQSVYARQENLKTEGENQSVLAGADGAKMRNQLCETFRIAYGMGLLDSALAFLFVKR